MGVWIRWTANYLLKAVVVVAVGIVAAMGCHMLCAFFLPMETEALLRSLRNQSVVEQVLNSIFTLFPAAKDALEGLNLLIGKVTVQTIDTPLLPLYDVTGGMILSGCAETFSFVYKRWLRQMCDIFTGTANRFIDWFMGFFITMTSLLIASFCRLPIYWLYDAAYAMSNNELIRTLAVVCVFTALLLSFVLLLKLFSNKKWSGALKESFGKILLGALIAGIIYLLIVSILSFQTGGEWMDKRMAMFFIIVCPIVIPGLLGYTAIRKN